MNDIIIVPALILLVMSIAAWAVIRAKWHWVIRCLCITIFTSTCLLIWPIVNNLRGWAIEKELPEIYMLHWVVVDEPDCIYLLIQDLSGEQPEKIFGTDILATSPRLYRIPYSRNAHKQSDNIQSMILDGKRIIMRRGKSSGKGGSSNSIGDENEGESPGEGNGIDVGGGYGEAGGEAPLGYIMPPPKLPSKRP